MPRWGGLNTQDPSPTLQSYESQSLLNVLLTPGGKGVYKREGYGLFQSLPIACSTCAVHGGYHFQQTGGNDVQLWGNDTELAGSVSDGNFVKLATGTVSATWQCADSQGFAYCLDSARDTPIKTDGSIANTSFQGAVPLGTMVAFTPLQMVVAGVSANPSTLYVSAQNNFTNFTNGINNQDPFTEVIAAPGSRITHIAYYFGKLFWWKDQSFGFISFSNQYDLQVVIVSNQIGTLDNSDAFWNSGGYDTGNLFSGAQNASNGETQGGIYFRGQDNHIYRFDGYFLTRISRVISPTVTSASRRKANAWQQTSQSDFQLGAILNNGSLPSLSTVISTNNVVFSTAALIDSTTAQFESGTFTNTIVFNGGVVLSTNAVAYPDNSFEGTSWGGNGAFPTKTTIAGSGACSISPQDGSQFIADITGDNTVYAYIAYWDGTFSPCTPITWVNNNCTWTNNTISVDQSKIGMANVLVFSSICHSINSANYTQYSGAGFSPLLNGTDLKFYSASTNNATFGHVIAIDDINNNPVSNIVTGLFTSRAFPLPFGTNCVNTLSTTTFSGCLTYQIDASTSTLGIWSSQVGGPAGISFCPPPSSNFTYVRYNTIYSNCNARANNSVFEFDIIPATGSFYSKVNNAPNLTGWSTFGADDVQIPFNGDIITYYTRASTSPFTVLSSTPVWVSQSKNATVTASTGTYFQARADFAAGDFQSVQLNDFQFNWFEGSASDKSYMAYFNDAIWISVSSGTSTAYNNRILYYDLINQSWLVHDIPSQGFMIENNSLYLGDPVQGRVFKYGGVTTDNAAPINSYWQSKDFLGTNPFVQNEYLQVDFVTKSANTTSLTYTYTLDTKTSASLTLNLFDSASSMIRRAQLLPIGKIGSYYNFTLSDNSSNPSWMVMAHRVVYNQFNWKTVP